MTYLTIALEFFASPLGKRLLPGLRQIGKWSGLAVAAALALGIARHSGAEKVRAEWETAKATAREAAHKADQSAARRAEATSNRDTAAEAVADKAAEESRLAYIAELEKRISALAPGDGCRGIVDLRRVRDLQ